MYKLLLRERSEKKKLPMELETDFKRIFENGTPNTGNAQNVQPKNQKKDCYVFMSKMQSLYFF